MAYSRGRIEAGPPEIASQATGTPTLIDSEMLIGGYTWRNRRRVSTVAKAHPINPSKSLKTFLSGFRCLGEGEAVAHSEPPRRGTQLIITYAPATGRENQRYTTGFGT